MNLHTLNPLAIFAAAASAFVLGGLWYSPFMLGAVWKRANHFEANPPTASAQTFLIAFILSLVMALNLALFLNDPKTTLAWGASAGFLAGFGWVAMSLGIVSVFERRSLSYVLVNAGYIMLALIIMGAILGAWR
jgi:hypothetical protein